MPFPSATIVSPMMHGPPIMGVGLPTVLIGNKPAWRVTDMHTCPMVNATPAATPHGPGTTGPPGCITVMAGGPILSSVTDMIIEPAAMVPPSPNLIMMAIIPVLSP